MKKEIDEQIVTLKIWKSDRKSFNAMCNDKELNQWELFNKIWREYNK